MVTAHRGRDGETGAARREIVQRCAPLSEHVREAREVPVDEVVTMMEFTAGFVIQRNPGVGAADIGDYAQVTLRHTGRIFMILVEPARPITAPRVTAALPGPV